MFKFFYLLVNINLIFSKVKILKTDELNEFVKKNEFAVILIKDKPSEFEKVFSDISDVFEGSVKFGSVDYNSKMPANFKAQKYPSVKIVTSGSNFNDYKKSLSAHDLYSDILIHLQAVFKKRFESKGFSVPETFVIGLTDNNFTKIIENSADHYLVEFFAPWCGHCKALAPHWKAAAEKLNGRMKLAAVDCTQNQNLASQFGIKGFPTIKFIPAGSKSPFVAEEYNGGRSTDDIISWAENKLSTLLPPPELVHIISQAQLEDKCYSHGICVMAFFPNRLDSDAKTWNKYIETIKKVIDVFKRSSYSWVWLEGAVDDKFEESLGVGGFGYPVVIALNHKKKAFSVMKDAFDVANIKNFLNSLGSKGVITEGFSGELPLLKDMKEWDGSEFKRSDL